MRSRLVSILLSATAIAGLILTGCAPEATTPPAATTAPSADATYQWKFASDCAPDSPRCQSIVGIVEELEQKSDGRIKIDFYPAAALGTWSEVTEQVMRGTLDLTYTGIPTQYDPRMEILVFPGLYASYADAAARTSPGGFIFELASDLFQDVGLKHLGTYPLGFGGMGFHKVPDFDPVSPDSDKKGAKIRIAPGKMVYELYITRWGYIPTGVPWADTYTALQTGVVEGEIGAGAESGWTDFRDVLECWVQANYSFEQNDMVMNLDLWNSLSPKDQEIVASTFAKYSKGGFDTYEELQEMYFGKMKDAGWKVIVLTDEQMAVQNEIFRNEIWPQLKSRVGSALYDEVVKEFATT
jgi:TRAP-type C4-dicarboxylate transport system substrate-binding protein